MSFYLALLAPFPAAIQAAEPAGLTARERQWLAGHLVIRVASDPDFPPIESIDKTGRLVGIAADYLKLLERKLGIRFEIVPVSSWDDALKKARSRDADIFSAATKSPKRSKYMSFASPHIELPGMIIVQNKTGDVPGLNGLHGKKVGVVSGYVWQEWIAGDHPEINLQPVRDVQTGLLLVSFGQLDAMVGNLATATYYIEKLGITNLRVAAETGYFARLAIASRKDWPELNAILQKAVSSIRREESQAILGKWIKIENPARLDVQTIMLGLLIIIAVAVAAVAGNLLWTRSLRKMVRRQSESLRENEERYRLLIEASPDAILVTDANRKIMFANSTAVDQFGADTVDQLIGLNMLELVHPDHRADVEARRLQALQGIRPPFIERRRLRLDGTDFFSESHGVPFTWDGEPAILIVVRDVTERKQAEAQLRQAQKMEAVGQLTGGVAHDFNNLLAIIMGNLELIEKQLDEGDEHRAMVLRAIDAAKRGATLTHRLLAFSRKQSLLPRATDVNELVVGMTDLFHRTLGETVELDTVLSETLPPVLVDPNQLENTLLNLAVNARDAMSEGGRLTIETATVDLDEDFTVDQDMEKPGRYVMLAVSDTGGGIAAEDRERVFEPFFTTKAPGKGSGLGLSMVHGFAKQSGSHVSIYREPDQGTTVRLYLPPAAPGEAAVGAEEAIAPTAPDGNGETVLVVEDDALVRETTVAMVAELGYSPLEANDAVSALGILDETPNVDLLFTDVVLTGSMNGKELGREAQRRRPRLKVLYTSGYTETAAANRGRLDRGVELVEKPYRMDQLAQRLHVTLR